jgi:hypothetical protein
VVRSFLQLAHGEVQGRQLLGRCSTYPLTQEPQVSVAGEVQLVQMALQATQAPPALGNMPAMQVWQVLLFEQARHFVGHGQHTDYFK